MPTAGKFNAGTMKRDRAAHLWCAFPWRRKRRWRPRPRKKPGDEGATSVVDGRADPAHRGRAVGDCLFAGSVGAQGVRGGKCVVGSGGIAAAFEWAVRGCDFRHSNAGSGEWGGSARVDSEEPPRTEEAHYFDQR